MMGVAGIRSRAGRHGYLFQVRMECHRTRELEERRGYVVSRPRPVEKWDWDVQISWCGAAFKFQRIAIATALSMRGIDSGNGRKSERSRSGRDEAK